MKAETPGCPRCTSGVVRALGNAGSPLEWYACQTCHFVWVTGASAPRTVPMTLDPITTSAGSHILVVDDDVKTLEIVARALARYRVSTATSGTEALAVLSAKPLVDLLLTDYRMPAMSGVELIREARALRPTIKTLVITGDPDALMEADPTHDASRGVIAKPFRFDTLLRAVEDLIGPPVC